MEVSAAAGAADGTKKKADATTATAQNEVRKGQVDGHQGI